MKNTTRNAHVHTQLRNNIISGRYSPGSPLRLAELSRELQTSMSGIREALIRLSGQHLVTQHPNQGFRVIQISLEDLENLTELRVALETLALRSSIERGGVEWEAQAVSSHHILERATLARREGLGTTEEWSIAHSNFHHALVSGCQNPRLVSLTQDLREGSEIYRQLSKLNETARPRDLAHEHRELLEHSTDRNADAAVTSLELHLRRTTAALLEHPGSIPAFQSAT